jgi:hypothetical protein
VFCNQYFVLCLIVNLEDLVADMTLNLLERQEVTLLYLIYFPFCMRDHYIVVQYSLSVAVHNLFSEQSRRKTRIIFRESALLFIVFGSVAENVLNNVCDTLFNNSSGIPAENSMRNMTLFISSQSFDRYFFH